jgi:hypothetical protein
MPQTRRASVGRGVLQKSGASRSDCIRSESIDGYIKLQPERRASPGLFVLGGFALRLKASLANVEKESPGSGGQGGGVGRNCDHVVVGQLLDDFFHQSRGAAGIGAHLNVIELADNVDGMNSRKPGHIAQTF